MNLLVDDNESHSITSGISEHQRELAPREHASINLFISL